MQLELGISEGELVRLFRAGSRQAAEEIARRYYPGVLRICRQTMGSESDGQDAAQTVFLKALAQKRLLGFRQESSLATWFFRVAVNTCYSLRKSMGTVYEVSMENGKRPEMEGCAVTWSTPEDVLALREETELFFRVLSRMSPKYQAALLAMYGKSATYREAAQGLGISPSAIGVRILRGKKMMERAVSRLTCGAGFSHEENQRVQVF